MRIESRPPTASLHSLLHLIDSFKPANLSTPVGTHCVKLSADALGPLCCTLNTSRLWCWEQEEPLYHNLPDVGLWHGQGGLDPSSPIVQARGSFSSAPFCVLYAHGGVFCQ